MIDVNFSDHFEKVMGVVRGRSALWGWSVETNQNRISSMKSINQLIDPQRSMRGILILLGFTHLFLGTSSLARADPTPKPAVSPHPPRISETQVALQVDQIRAQATVIGISKERLTVLTAAHFLAESDAGKAIQISQPAQEPIQGQVIRVWINPDFPAGHPNQPRRVPAQEAVGVDSEIIQIQLQAQATGVKSEPKGIRAADLALRPTPAGDRRVLRVRIMDQFGEEHNLLAGNHLNPKCLAWGRGGFEPRPGDSGAGVFFVIRNPEGEEIPVLIGNVSQVDSRGGIASIVYRNAKWMEDALETNR